MRVNRSAKENIAVANQNYGTLSLMRKRDADDQPTQLPEFLKARIGRGKMTAIEVMRRGGLRDSYIGELMKWPKAKGSKSPWKMSANAICRLAKGMGESPVIVFQAVINKLQPGITDHHLIEILERFNRLRPSEKSELDFMLRKLADMIDEKLDRHT